MSHVPGTWRMGGVCAEGDVFRVSNDVSKELAATVSVNPCTGMAASLDLLGSYQVAYRMLKDFKNLEQGAWVAQNGANSGVGQAVIQLARAWGLKSFNVIRDRYPSN